MSEDEWFAEHPWLNREWWLSIDHTNCAQYPDQFNFNFDAPAYQRCGSMHCPKCNKATGAQGHRDCAEAAS
ncbi:hypothetical protein [Mycobacterium sp. SMC-13]|uniref:hypothetical protein n=1 Tax=Mycobacterium sp. SMC-13 TaxID=3381626 RepID=UPI003875ECF8